MPQALALSGVASGPTTAGPDVANYLQFLNEFDWSKTCLGPIASWPTELKTLVELFVWETQPKLLMLGSDLIMIYNASYAQIAGEKHPAALGQPAKKAWSEIAHVIDASKNHVLTTGTPNIETGFTMFRLQEGALEEIIFSWNTIPLPQYGGLSGFSSTLLDETESRNLERRAATLRAISDVWDEASSVESLWHSIINSMTEYAVDFPFAFLYASRLDSSPASFHGQSHSVNVDDGIILDLKGYIGDFKDACPVSSDQEAFFAQAARQALSSGEPFILRETAGTLPQAWSMSSVGRGYGDPCRTAALIPVRSNVYPKVQALLVVGLRTRTKYNPAYHAWLLELRRALLDAVTSAKLSEDESRRQRDAAQALALREKIAQDMTGQFQRFLRVMELSEGGIFECNTAGLRLQTNTTCYHQNNFPKDRAREQFSWLDVVHEDDVELVMSNWHRMMQGQHVTYEMRWKSSAHPEGRWNLAVCLPVLDENGVVTSISGCTTDIHAQKRAEQEAVRRAEALERARAAEQRLLRFTETAPLAMKIMEYPSLAMTYCNETWWKMTQHPRVPLEQFSWRNIAHEEDLVIRDRAWKQATSTGKSASFQTRLKHMWTGGDGHRHQTWVACSLHPELHEDGTVKAVMTTMSDISHLKWAEYVQRLRVEEAIEAKRQQENFIDMTSHEIRNPLGAVVHCADSIAESLSELEGLIQRLPPTPLEDDEKANFHALIANSVDAVNTITSCSAHQKRIVDDLLTLSKLDSKLLKICLVPNRASTIVSDMHNMFSTEATQAGISFCADADASLAGLKTDWMMLDTGRIHQILINLITNAIKFTKNKEVREVHMTMGVSEQRPSESNGLPLNFKLARSLRDSVSDVEDRDLASDNKPLFLWFSVKDTGRGMSQEEMKRLFSRFSQADKRTYSEYGGSGLGLFISRELSELQGGEIGVASEPGVGSTFAFFVKTYTPSSPVDAPVSPILTASALRVPSHTNGESGRVSVLVVEDNTVNARVLKKQLTKQGYDVHLAENGQEALDFLQKTRYWKGAEGTQDVHVILMDVEMPIMNGITATKNIRLFQQKGDIQGHIPIIAVSANARPEQTADAINAGMDDSISKPFRIADLTPKIDRLAKWVKAEG